LNGVEENIKRAMKRVEAGDPAAMYNLGVKHYHKGDYNSAFEYLANAAELGHVNANFYLATMYAKGEGVEKDKDKELYHWEKAAIGGHPDARFNLGWIELKNGRTERAVKHFIIAAKLGCEGESMEMLWVAFKDGLITKDDLEATLRAHHSAVDATKSPQREAAAAAQRERAA
jgi:TPR repeat protein